MLMKKIFFAILFFIKPALSQTSELWGLTSAGGLSNKGTAFKINTDATNFQVVHEFDDTNGGIPTGNLILASDNLLYGLAQAGGVYNYGVLFTIDPDNYLFTKKFDFNSNSPLGETPMGSMIEGSNGKLYGMNWKTLFDYDILNDTLTPHFSFQSNMTDGWLPYETAMIEATNNKL